MPWRAIPPAAWACPITSAGSGDRRADIPHRLRAGLSGAAGQHDRDAALPAPHGRRARADDSARRRAASDAGCSSRRCTKDAIAAATTSRRQFAEEYGSPLVHREAGLLGTGGAVQRRQARLDGRHRRLPERRRHLHRLHHARLSRQVHAVHGSAAGLAALVRRGHDLRTGDSRPAPVHAGVAQQGARLAARPRGRRHASNSRRLARPEPAGSVQTRCSSTWPPCSCEAPRRAGDRPTDQPPDAQPRGEVPHPGRADCRPSSSWPISTAASARPT